MDTKERMEKVYRDTITNCVKVIEIAIAHDAWDTVWCQAGVIQEMCKLLKPGVDE